MAVKGMYLMPTGEVTWNREMELYGGDRNQKTREQMFAVLIDTDDGYVLVDTGYPPADKRVFEYLNEPSKDSSSIIEGVPWARADNWKVTSVTDIRNCLKERGLKPDDMRYVVVTHFHWDHVGGAKFFKNSKIVVHKDALSYAKWPDPFWKNNFHIKEWWDLDAMDLKYEVVLGDKLIVPGVMVMFTPGHAYGHLSVIINCPKDGQIIWAGDIFHIQDNWEKRLPMDDMNFATHDPQAWFKSWDRIKAYADMNNARVYASHDYEYLNSIPWEYH